MAFKRHSYLTTVEFMNQTQYAVERCALKGSFRSFDKACVSQILRDAITTCGKSNDEGGLLRVTLDQSPPIRTLDDLVPFDAEHYLAMVLDRYDSPAAPEPHVIRRIDDLIMQPHVSVALKWAVWRVIFVAQKRDALAEKVGDLLRKSWVKIFASIALPRETVLTHFTYILMQACLTVVSALCPKESFMNRPLNRLHQGFIVFVFQQLSKDLIGITFHESTIKTIMETNFEYEWDDEAKIWKSPYERRNPYTTTQLSPMVSKYHGEPFIRTKMDPGRTMPVGQLALPDTALRIARATSPHQNGLSGSMSLPGFGANPAPHPTKRRNVDALKLDCTAPWGAGEDFVTQLRSKMRRTWGGESRSISRGISRGIDSRGMSRGTDSRGMSRGKESLASRGSLFGRV